jgi:hypothetical protein
MSVERSGLCSGIPTGGQKRRSGEENVKKKKKKRTKHIQDAEHLRPLREYLAMHYRPPKKKLYLKGKPRLQPPIVGTNQQKEKRWYKRGGFQWKRTDAGLCHGLTVIREALEAAEEERACAL